MNGEESYIEYVIPRDDTVYVVEFCNVELSSQLLAVGTDSKVSIYQCKFRVCSILSWDFAPVMVPATFMMKVCSDATFVIPLRKPI